MLWNGRCSIKFVRESFFFLAKSVQVISISIEMKVLKLYSLWQSTWHTLSNLNCNALVFHKKLSNNTHTHVHTLLLEYIQTLKTSCLGLQTQISSQKRKHCILRWKALHSLHGNVHNISGRIWAVYQFASESIGFARQMKVLKVLQSLVNAFFYCYLFLIADFVSFWMLQNYFMLATHF